MKRMMGLLAITLAYGSLALAQQRTEIEITDGQITGAKQVQVPVSPAMPTFAEADANGDGCVNRQEAFNVGILAGDFDKFARKGCLNEATYQEAAHF